MGRPRNRLSPEEVKQALAKEREGQGAGAAPERPAFNTPFAAMADRLAQVKLKKPPPPRRERPAAPAEPSVLSQARAARRAAEAARDQAIAPRRRPGARVVEAAKVDPAEVMREEATAPARAADDLPEVIDPATEPAARGLRPSELFPHPPRR